MLPPNPLDSPPVEVPHTWCNFMMPDGHVWQTLHTADPWAYCFFLWVDSDGAHVYFFKRTAQSMFTFLGGFIEGLEKTEEWFSKDGYDIPGWAEWIKRYSQMARSDAGPADHEDQQGMVIGGPWNPFYAHVEQFYAEHPAWEHA